MKLQPAVRRDRRSPAIRLGIARAVAALALATAATACAAPAKREKPSFPSRLAWNDRSKGEVYDATIHALHSAAIDIHPQGTSLESGLVVTSPDTSRWSDGDGWHCRRYSFLVSEAAGGVMVDVNVSVETSVQRALMQRPTWIIRESAERAVAADLERFRANIERALGPAAVTTSHLVWN
jgi:hypothetical protein